MEESLRRAAEASFLPLAGGHAVAWFSCVVAVEVLTQISITSILVSVGISTSWYECKAMDTVDFCLDIVFVLHFNYYMAADKVTMFFCFFFNLVSLFDCDIKKFQVGKI